MHKKIIHAIAAVVIVAACALSAVGGRQTAYSPKPASTYTEEHFEGLGAFTLGCSIWDAPYLIHDEGTEDTPRRFLVLMYGEDPTGEVSIRAWAKGPYGVAMVNGIQCGNSINWGAFPALIP